MSNIRTERARMAAERKAREYLDTYPDGGMLTFSALLHAMEYPESALAPIAASLTAQAAIMRNTVKYHGGVAELLDDAQKLEAAADVLHRMSEKAGEA